MVIFAVERSRWRETRVLSPRSSIIFGRGTGNGTLRCIMAALKYDTFRRDILNLPFVHIFIHSPPIPFEIYRFF